MLLWVKLRQRWLIPAYAKISFNEDALKSGAENLHTASVMFTDSEGEMLTGVTIESVEPWMKTMGHGSNDEQLDFHQHDDMGHHWMITGIIFSMGGEAGSWVIEKVKFNIDGTSDEVHLPVPAVE